MGDGKVKDSEFETCVSPFSSSLNFAMKTISICYCLPHTFKFRTSKNAFIAYYCYILNSDDEIRKRNFIFSALISIQVALLRLIKLLVYGIYVYSYVRSRHNKVIIISQYFTIENLFPATCFGLIGTS
jgi:hypothetical protein